MSNVQVHSVVHRDCMDICFEGYVFRLVVVGGNEVEILEHLSSIPEDVGNAFM